MSGMVSERLRPQRGFKERERTNSNMRRLVATTFKTNHHEITVSPLNFLPSAAMVWHEDERSRILRGRPLFCFPVWPRNISKSWLTARAAMNCWPGTSLLSEDIYNLAWANVTPACARTVKRTGRKPDRWVRPGLPSPAEVDAHISGAATRHREYILR